MARVPFVWAAFDLDAATSELPVPCLGLCVDADFFARRFGAHLPAPDPAHVLALADDSFQRLLGTPLPPILRDRVAACLFTKQVVPKHFSFMLGRSPATFKLDVQLPVDQVADLLRGVGWAGFPERIQERIRGLMTWSGSIQLNLVLHPQVVGPLEVEFLTVPDAEQCCGSAGLFTLVQPAMSRAVLAPKLERLRAAAPQVVATGNPGCVMQLGAGLRAAGVRATLCHPVELLDASYAAAGHYA